MDLYSPGKRFNSPEFAKQFHDCMSNSEKDAKPSTCLLCGKPTTSFCNSHSIPKCCLKNISDDGHVYTINQILNFGPIDREKGLARTGTFRLICKECDNQFFKNYENPTAYLDEPNQQMLGQIATKDLLLEINKASILIALDEKTEQNDTKAVRELDFSENMKALGKAVHAGRGKGSPYKLIMFQQLNYVVPFAFQGVANLVSDFDGHMINNLFLYNQSYRLEPLHIAVFPLKHFSVVLLFRNAAAKRYKNLKRRF